MIRQKRENKQGIGGPYLAAAVFCDSILQEADGALSAIRIIDKINVSVAANAPEDFPSDERRLPVVVWTLLMFKSGSAPGEHEVLLRIKAPSGESKDGPRQRVNFSDEPTGGANLKIQLGIAVRSSGLFLVDVALDGKVVTTMPLLISVTRENAPEPTSATTQTPRTRHRKKK